jgi:hypothetical protein
MEKRKEFRRRVAEEQRFLSLARKEFQAGRVRGEGSAKDRSYYLYLLGDIDRRSGAFEAGAMALQAVAADKDTAEEVAVLVRDILRVLEVQDKTGAGYKMPIESGGAK